MSNPYDIAVPEDDLGPKELVYTPVPNGWYQATLVTDALEAEQNQAETAESIALTVALRSTDAGEAEFTTGGKTFTLSGRTLNSYITTGKWEGEDTDGTWSAKIGSDGERIPVDLEEKKHFMLREGMRHLTQIFIGLGVLAPGASLGSLGISSGDDIASALRGYNGAPIRVQVAYRQVPKRFNRETRKYEVVMGDDGKPRKRETILDFAAPSTVGAATA